MELYFADQAASLYKQAYTIVDRYLKAKQRKKNKLSCTYPKISKKSFSVW